MKPFTQLFSFFILLLFSSSAFAEFIEEPLIIKEQYPSKDAVELTADDVARFAVLRSLNIQVAQTDFSIKTQDITESLARYDTNLTANAFYEWEEEEQPTVILGNRSITGHLDASLKKKTPFGLEVELFHETQRNSTNSAFSAINPVYESHAGLEIRQALLQNFFGIVDRSEVNLVKLDVSQFREEVLDQIETIVFDSRTAFWSYVETIRFLETQQKGYEFSKDFYEIVKKQLDTGLSELPDFYAAEANLREKIQNILDAQLQVKIAMNELKLQLSYYDELAPKQELTFTDVKVSFDEVMDTAMKYRRDYKQKLIDIESSGIQIKVDRMKKLPQLDGVAIYGSNALDEDLVPEQGEVFGFNHARYYVGFELSYPLENRQAKADEQRSQLELKKAKLELEQLTQQIQVDVENVYKEITISNEKVRQAIKIAELQKKKLEEELKQYRVGRSSSKIIIDYQNDALDAETGKIEAFVEYEIAKDLLLFTQNRLLEALDLTVKL